MPPYARHPYPGHAGHMGHPGHAGPYSAGMAAGPGYAPAYGHPYGGGYGGYGGAYDPGYPGPGYAYQHHQQLVHRPNANALAVGHSESERSKCGMFWRYVWKLSSCLCSHVTLVSLVVGYCLLGAETFKRLEEKNEMEVKMNVTLRRSNVTQWLWTMTSDTAVLHQENWTSSAIERLKLFEKELLWAMRSQGWDGSEDVEVLQWTFAGALFYSIIVITTIGYGHIAPKTSIGKVVTIFYAILGIPLMLLCLSNIGDVMAQSFRFLYWRVCCYVCTRKPQPQGFQQRRGTRLARSRPPSSRSSRMTSMRRSGRVSTRSADGVLHAAHGVVRASHSDTECRYPDEDRDVGYRDVGYRDVGYRDRGYRGASLGPPMTVPMAGPRYPDADQRLPGGGGAGGPGVPGPVLFNKYALDREESGRAREGQRRLRAQSVGREGGREGRRRGPSVGPGGSLPRQHRLAERHDFERGPPVIRDSLKSSQRSSGYGSGPHRRHHSELAPSPRIMSPMGFGMNRNLFRVMHGPGDGLADGLGGMDADLELGGWDAASSAGPGGPIRPVPIWLCVFLVVSYIFGGAFLFSNWEKWHFLDSAYFCFITLTTIGFGDFVPAQRVTSGTSGEVSIALCSLYLLFGIALLAMSFNLVQEEVISSVRAVARRLGIIKADPEDD